MPVSISWYFENRVIFADVEGVVDIGEMNSSNDTFIKLLDGGQAPIHMLVDTSKLTQFPTNLNTLRKSQVYLSHPNVGWIIMVNTNPLLNFLTHIVTSIASANTRMVKSLEEGKQLLRKLDATVTV